MTVKEIVVAYLKTHGYDGLAADECGCALDDLMPCGQPGDDCVTAHKRQCQHCAGCCEDGENYCEHQTEGGQCLREANAPTVREKMNQ